MKAPICKVCLNSNVICKACSKIVNELGLSKNEISLFRKLNKLEKSIKVLEDVDVKRIISNGKIVIIVGKGQAARFIGKRGINIKKLKKFFKKVIKVVEESDDMKTFIQNIVFPVPLLGLNVIYDNGERYVIRIPNVEKRELPLTTTEIVKVCKSLFKKDFEVRFE